jgi:hypothetical protein
LLGRLVGWFLDADLFHGLSLRNGVFTVIDFPGAVDTQLFGINPQGDIVGAYDMGDGVTHGLLRTSSGMTSFDYPGSSGTFGFRITAQRNVVGTYTDGDGNVHGYLWRCHGQHAE